MAGHVFISHGSENRDEANELCAFIEGKGVKAWIAPRDVRPGIDYSEELQAAIETCAAFVVLVTDMANKSPYVRAETEMAFSCHKPIFPVRQADIKPASGLALFLKIRHWTDAYGKYREAAMERLALELQTVVGITPSAPAPAPVPAPLPPPAPPPLPDPAPPVPPRAPAPAPVPAPAPIPSPGQERLAAAIGPNAAWYQARWQAMDARGSQISWNWAACLLSLWWFAYRRMWVPAVVLGVVFVALCVLSLLSTPLMIAGGVLFLLASTATGALGTAFYRQQVGRLIGGAAAMDHGTALAELRAKGGVSMQGAMIFVILSIAVAGGSALIGWRQAQNRASVVQNFLEPGGDKPFGTTPGTIPGATPGANVPGVGPNGEIDEEALRNALQEARNLLEEQGVNPDQVPQTGY
jgi:hypothetical protein